MFGYFLNDFVGGDFIIHSRSPLPRIHSHFSPYIIMGVVTINGNVFIGGILYPRELGDFEVIVKYNGDISAVAAEIGAEIEILNESYAILTVNTTELTRLLGYSEVEYIELPKTLTYMLEKSLISSCVSSAQDRFGLTGKGVIVGIIDSGIDYNHPDFKNPDGTTRILYIWDQTTAANPPGTNPPAGFAAGVEYTADMLNAALKDRFPNNIIPRLDTVGHGTAVASVAAGNGRASGGRNKGVAYEASIIAVRLGTRGSESFARTTEIMRAYKYILDKATALNMPVSINLSYGTNDGSHDGNSLFETYIDSMATRWKSVLCVATGNEGFSGHHFGGTAIASGFLDVEFVTAGQLPRFYMTLWKNFADTFSFELIAPNGDIVGPIRPGSGITRQRLGNADVTVIYGEPTHYNISQEVYFNFEAASEFIPPGLWRLRVTATQVVDGRFDIWLPVLEEVSAQTAFTTPDPETTLTIPSTALNVVSVGAYNSLTDASADFSGRGFTRHIVYVKPDIVAPGVGIITARPGGGYDAFTGTSIATPFVTGAAALMLEWGIVKGNDPFLYGQKVKAYLRKGAQRSPGATYPNPIRGYGTLCLLNTMRLLT